MNSLLTAYDTGVRKQEVAAGSPGTAQRTSIRVCDPEIGGRTQSAQQVEFPRAVSAVALDQSAWAYRTDRKP
jgi:hypothetical protein